MLAQTPYSFSTRFEAARGTNPGHTHKAFMAAGVALPPTLRDKA